MVVKIKYLIIFLFLFTTNASAFLNKNKNYQDEMDSLVKSIEKKMKSDKDLNILKKNMWIDKGEVPFKYYTNKNFVTKEERKALEKLQNYVAINQKEYLKIEGKYFPFNVPYFEKYFASTFTVFLDLYDGKITYGEYYRIKKELWEKTRSTALEAWKYKNANQINKFDQITKAFQDYLKTQKLINEVFQPSRKQSFTCTQNGKIINCW